MAMASKLSSFLAELRRRKVYRVAGVYVAVGLGTLGAAEVILDPLGLGDLRGPIVILVLLGFPIALVLAWAYEVRPEVSEAREPTQVATAPGEKKSIVVLPFDNMSPESGDGYFSEGLTEEIITNLSYLPSLRVISRSSAMALKGTAKDVRTIGRELDVQYVVEGSVRKAGDDLLVTAQLIDAGNDEHIWAKKYDGVLDDVFSIQERLSRAIVDAVGAVLAGPGEADAAASDAPMSGKGPEFHSVTRTVASDRRAFEAYLKGKYAIRQGTEEAWHEAVRWFEEAIGIDPQYTPAYLGKAEALTMPITGFGVYVDPEKLRRARTTIEEALALDPGLPEAHTWLGVHSMYFDWDRKAAGAAFSTALRLSPDNADAHVWRAWYLCWLEGDHKAALESVQVAEGLDPLNLFLPVTRGYVYYASGALAEALADFHHVIAMEPSFAMAHYGAGDALAQMGRLEEAIQEYEKCIEFGGRTTHVIALLAYAHGRLAEREKAEQYIAELKERSDKGFISAAALAWAYSGLEAWDVVLEWLDKAVVDREPAMVYLGFTHEVDPLRRDARFNEILRRVGIGHLAVSS
jgi:TolB-like protein/Tfp pilus assembly protein PilF